MTPYKMTNLSDTEIDAYCSKFKLSRTRYLDEKRNLEHKKDSEGNRAYSEEQINRLILRKSSKKTIERLLNLHDELIKNELTPQQIYQIAAHDGGSKNLSAYIEQTRAVQANNQSWASLDLKVEDLLRILAHGGGSQALNTLLRSLNQLHHLGFTTTQLVTIAANKGGAQALAAVLKHTSQLLTHGYNLDFIYALAAKSGGAKKIQQTKSNKSLNSRHEELITIGNSQEQVFTYYSTTELDAFIHDIDLIDDDELSELLHSFTTSEDTDEEDALLFGDKNAECQALFSAIEQDSINQTSHDTDEEHDALLFGDKSTEYNKLFSAIEQDAAKNTFNAPSSSHFFYHKRSTDQIEANTQEYERKKAKRDEEQESPLTQGLFI